MVPIYSALAKIEGLGTKAPNPKFQAPMKLQNSSSKRSRRAIRFGAWCLLFLWSLELGAWSFNARAAETNSPLSTWIAAQANIHTWSADVVQTRTLKSLTQPLTAEGHVWFEAPNRFRWELGNPPQTIAVRGPEEMLVIYPRLKHAERYALGGEQSGQWRDLMKLTEAGFPRSEAELQSQYNILSQQVHGGICELTLQPKSATARKMMPQIKISFSTKDSSLTATELQFADGSTMRNDFKNAQLNPKVDESMFTPKLASDYKIVEPFKQ
jgi:outer membrane lipoprotein-sorting protein